MALFRGSTVRIAALGVAAFCGGCNLVLGLTDVPPEVDASVVQTVPNVDASLPEASVVAPFDASDSARTDGGIQSDVLTENDAGSDGETTSAEACAELPGYCTNHCGTVYDNCGTAVSCPGCEGGVPCTAGSCGCDPEPATTTCMGKNCGPATNNCGQSISCPNTCTASGKACSGNQCLLDNGQTCLKASDCLSNVCSTFYVDADQDGHGWAGTPTSVCGTTPPPDYVQSSDDCCDQDPYTFPGQTEWFTAPSSFCVGPPINHDPWDYNCDGVEPDEQEWTETRAITCVPSGQNCFQMTCTCPTDFMWDPGPVPACGVSGQQMQCGPPFSSPGGWFCNATVNAQGEQYWSATQGCH